MISETWTSNVGFIPQRLDQVTEWQLGLLRGLLITFLPWAVWRLWKFTIYPLLHPDEPLEFPYLVPMLGHGLAFFKDSNGLLARGRRYFEGRTAPFALTAFGHTFYVIAHAKHSAEVYKNTDSLSFEEFVQKIMQVNGCDEQTIKAMYSPLPADDRLKTRKVGFPNPEGLSMGQLAQRIHVAQLHPGENLTDLQDKTRFWINRELRLDTLIKQTKYARPTGSSTRFEVPLYQWTSDTFVRLGQYCYFGDVLSKLDPEYTDAYLVFDEVIWKMLYQYPSILCRDMTAARERMIKTLRAYFALPASERRKEAAFIITTIEDEMKAIDVDDENIAVMVFHLYFAINTNARKTSFWMLAHLMRNPEYLAAFRAETAPAFRGDELVDMAYIQDAEKCPEVEAMWLETLRVAGWAASVRLVTRDVVIGGRKMRQGNRVMVPHRLLHYDGSVFGAEPDAWRPARWLEDNDASRKLPNSPSWRPFGGGRTMCSGRFLAKSFVTSFVATLLRRFDVEPVGNPPMPQPDVGRPVLGTISVKEGQDFFVSVTKRQAVNDSAY